ncbi:murein L,D-transpeptidase [Negadavirga shengliensis]|uniref:Murein L,D-transpeptidase n=1 Tax=Negadavirga shengliensis TaxID=1389218 RepID=A0ABV9SUS4_9BACT
MKKYFFVWGMFALTAPGLAQTSHTDERISLEIRKVFEASEDQNFRLFENTYIHSPDLVLEFYSQRDFREAWIEDGKLTRHAYEFRYLVRRAKYDGLVPEDYHLPQIDDFFEAREKNERYGSAMELAAADIVLTDAFILYAGHLYSGKVDPEHAVSGWNIEKKSTDPKILKGLEDALAEGEIREHLEAFRPKFPVYQRMQRSLVRYYEKEKEITGTWNPISIRTAIKPNERHAAIPVIRERLLFWNELEVYEWTDKDLYDSLMLSGVQAFQQKNGLNPDGVIGSATVRALNKNPRDLIRQTAVNLERLRWLPDTILQEFILVNIANYSMDYIKNRDTLLHSNAIVGRAYRRTPVFNAPMTYLVFSPTWTVPPGILRNDVIPAVKKDPRYLASKNMRLLTHSGNEVDPYTLDWSSISASNFPYMVRQDPGPDNSLGLVKFMFPNRYNVYIHDTPARELFARDDRALSSGCIRIQKPFELAYLLLADQPLWTGERILMAMNSGREQKVSLRRQIPVIILYLTFWTAGDGTPMVRHDVYERDQDLYKLLTRKIASDGLLQKL